MTTRVTLVHSGPEAVYVEAFNPSTRQKIWTAPKILRYPGDALTEYVHSGMSLSIREETQAERDAAKAPMGPDASQGGAA